LDGKLGLRKHAPLRLTVHAPESTDNEAVVGDKVGEAVVGDSVGEAVGDTVVGEEVVGDSVGETVGDTVGEVGDTDGEAVGETVGEVVGDCRAVGAQVGAGCSAVIRLSAAQGHHRAAQPRVVADISAPRTQQPSVRSVFPGWVAEKCPLDCGSSTARAQPLLCLKDDHHCS
jgi:hypothetical protein